MQHFFCVRACGLHTFKYKRGKHHVQLINPWWLCALYMERSKRPTTESKGNPTSLITTRWPVMARKLGSMDNFCWQTATPL
mmetsp:Transcript_54179/g.96376  ORF Transcript_54179/g.96376 Transcript_54179/m.96376 type:complete len:81 (+) Transcript_54179:502-744(+)